MTVLYLLRVECPKCGTIVPFIEEREEPVGLMEDVSLGAQYCPHCGVHASEVGRWDLHEETEVERCEPTEASA